jgi:hypothetical protein
VLREGRDIQILLLQKKKKSSKEGGNVFLASSRTHADHEAWLVDSSTPFHMTPHWKWFCEYERYNGGDVFLGHESIAKIIGCGNVKLNLMDGKIRKLLGVSHILGLAINFDFYNKNG